MLFLIGQLLTEKTASFLGELSPISVDEHKLPILKKLFPNRAITNKEKGAYRERISSTNYVDRYLSAYTLDEYNRRNRKNDRLVIQLH